MFHIIPFVPNHSGCQPETRYAGSNLFWQRFVLPWGSFSLNLASLVPLQTTKRQRNCSLFESIDEWFDWMTRS